MKNEDYNRLIQNNMKKGFDLLIPIAAAMLFVSAFFLRNSNIPRFFLFIDFGLGLFLVAMAVIRDRIDINTKITVSALLTIVLGVLSFLDGGFNSSGVTLILMANMVATMLMSKIRSVILSIFSVAAFIALWVFTKTYGVEGLDEIKDVEWIIQFVVFVLFIFAMHVMVSLVREYLIENIKKLEETGSQTRWLAFYHKLTGLPNQNMFMQRIAQKCNDKECKGYIAIYKTKNLDIVNSIYDEKFGDNVLVDIANIFSKRIGDEDFLSLNNGNKFTFWLANMTEQDFESWINKTNSVINEYNYASEMIVNLEFYKSCSICTEGKSIAKCYHRVCLALAYAKQWEKSDMVSYNREVEENIFEGESMKESLLDSLVKGDFDIHYQPKIDVLEGKIVGVEALARWHTESLGPVSPDVFIPLIERSGKSIDFGEFIIEKVLGEYEDICMKYGEGIHVAINISPTHLLSKGFVEYLGEIIEKFEIDPERLVIEITEAVIINDEGYANEVFGAIHELGARVSLDDFGTGYSSLNYLLKLNVDEIKIDKTFIDQMIEGEKADTLLISIAYIAKNYDLELVAEGVETIEQKDHLSKLGCRVMQGFYFAKPQPLQQSVEMVTTKNGLLY
ncbi:MAG TPA: EAL domain-containing protein [Clostridia bacterium]|nr:EAL domain-containing protein [Clostridia bacterium]